ncbi:MAG TPA: glycosyltransferase family 10 [Acidobacteriaceae bacterium]|nr:glycosyltransferase family 10 [Acidobacteriaceae bacterium]
MSVSVYVHPKTRHTIFQKDHTRAVLFQYGVRLVESPEEATVLVGNRERFLHELIDAFGASKRYLLWTHEPFYWTLTGKWANIGGQRVRTISLHSGEVFFNNYFYSSICSNPYSCTATPRRRLNRTAVIVSGAKSMGDPAVVARANKVDLLQIRYELAIAGHRAGLCDVYGKDWPPGVSRGESRLGAWSLAKYEILEQYDFNICFENSLVPYYCSEKIWQAIHCGCLPIYYGQASIYQDFSEDSFLDYAHIGSPEALFDIVHRMTVSEFNERYGRCLEIFERAFPLGRPAQEHAAHYAAMQIVALNLAAPERHASESV